MNNPKKVLLIEENRQAQYLFVRAIEKIENVTMSHIATNGLDALYKLQHSSALPDIIFTDIHMPFMNGMDCLKEIVRDPRTKNIPVVVLSSDTTKAGQAQQIGAKAFIKKPTDCKILQEQIEPLIHLDFATDTHIANQTFQQALSA